MNDTVQTWHYGLVARYWAENIISGPEIAYYQRQVEQYGQPALDAGCGTGRLRMLLEKAGFRVEAEKGNWTDADANADHDVIVYIARK